MLEEELDVNISVYERLGFSSINATHIVPLPQKFNLFGVFQVCNLCVLNVGQLKPPSHMPSAPNYMVSGHVFF